MGHNIVRVISGLRVGNGILWYFSVNAPHFHLYKRTYFPHFM